MVELNNGEKKVLFGGDSIVVRQYISGAEGGRALDMTDFGAVELTNVVKAGTFIIKDSDGTYKPAPIKKDGEGNIVIDDSKFVASKVVGILVATINGKIDGAGIMTAGRVNKAVLPYGGTAKVADVKSVLSHIEFMEDGE